MSGAWLGNALRSGEQLPWHHLGLSLFFPLHLVKCLSQPTAFALLLCTVMLGEKEV